MHLSQEEFDLLAKNVDYEYEISLIGRKLSAEELKDKKNINLNDYGNKKINKLIIFIFYF